MTSYSLPPSRSVSPLPYSPLTPAHIAVPSATMGILPGSPAQQLFNPVHAYSLSPASYPIDRKLNGVAMDSSPGFSTSHYPVFLPAPGMPIGSPNPGFLSGAGYHFGFTFPQDAGTLGSPGTVLFHSHLGQNLTPLHRAAILGDKQKVAEILQDKSINVDARDRWGRVPLVYAVLANHTEVVELLLKEGAQLDVKDVHKRTPLHFAANKGRTGCIRALLNSDESKEREGKDTVWLMMDVHGVTPLHQAAHHGSAKCLHLFLKWASLGTLDVQDQNKRTPLHWAAAYGSEENVKLLLKFRANGLLPDNEGKIPLHWAALSQSDGAKGCVMALLSAAPSSVNWQDYEGISALHLSTEDARLGVIDAILAEPKCDSELADHQYRTALHWACSRGQTEVVGRLVNRKVNLRAGDIHGATALHYAALMNHAKTVEMLVQLPFTPNDITKEGHSALLWAAAKGCDDSILVMARHNIGVNQPDPVGVTALHLAAAAGHVSTVAVLLQLGAQINSCDAAGRSPLLHAARAGHVHLVKWFMKEGAALDLVDGEGRGALHHAVMCGHLYLAQTLIRAGLPVDLADYYGRTSLHCAAFRGLIGIMNLLLENGACINAQDNEGKTALHWATEQRGNLTTVKTLLQFGAYPNFLGDDNSRQMQITPLDCAFIAEQFEVAKILEDAGGVSALQLQNVAASRIQAFWRMTLLKRGWKRQANNLGESKRDLVAAMASISDYSTDGEETTLESKGSSHCRFNSGFEGSYDSATDTDREHTQLDIGSCPSMSEHWKTQPTVTLIANSQTKASRNLSLPELDLLGIDADDELKSNDTKKLDVLPLQHALQLTTRLGVALVVHGLADDGETEKSEEIGESEERRWRRKALRRRRNRLRNKNKSEGSDEDENFPVSPDLKISHRAQRQKIFSDVFGRPSTGPNWSKQNESADDDSSPDDTQARNRHTSKIHRTHLSQQKIFSDVFERPSTEPRWFKLNESSNDDSSDDTQARNCHTSKSRRTHLSRRAISLSADVREKAQEKWNDKIASLTLREVKRPRSTSMISSYSYNMTSGNTPSTKKK